MEKDNKTVVVTGCNRGIGRAIFELFHKRKINVWACARKKSQGFSDFIKDLKNADDKEAFIKDIYFDFDNNSERFSYLFKFGDILVNNAGTIHTAPFQMTTIETFKKVFNTNFFSQLYFTQYILKNMVKNKRGSIVNILEKN